MRTKAQVVFAWTCLGLLSGPSVARADLGSHYVFTTQLDGAAAREVEAIKESIYDALARSSIDCDDVIYVLNIDGRGEKGSYAIQLIERYSVRPATDKTGKPSGTIQRTDFGYMISAADLDGLKKGAAEAIEALGDKGGLDRLPSGTREGSVTPPAPAGPPRK